MYTYNKRKFKDMVKDLFKSNELDKDTVLYVVMNMAYLIYNA